MASVWFFGESVEAVDCRGASLGGEHWYGIVKEKSLDSNCSGVGFGGMCIGPSNSVCVMGWVMSSWLDR